MYWGYIWLLAKCFSFHCWLLNIFFLPQRTAQPCQQGMHSNKAEDRWMISRLYAAADGRLPSVRDLKKIFDMDEVMALYAQKKYPCLKGHALIKRFKTYIKFKPKP